jgi:hypothetical protein
METIPEINGNVTEVETVENVVIKTEKIEKNGVQHRRIISVDGCITEKEAKALPGYVRYMAGQAVYLTKFGIGDEKQDAIQMYGHKNNVPHIVVGREIREDLFQNAVRHIGLALNRLREIKVTVEEKEKEKWEGEEVVTIKPVETA